MNLKFQIESLLFISGQPFSAEKVGAILGIKKAAAEEELKELKEEYNNRQSGVVIVVIDNKYQMATSPDTSETVQKFLKEEVIGELTRPQLETLTIIAYRGPISKVELEQIRGVNCSLILRNLLIRGLAEQKTNKDGMETYLITHEFLRFLGLTEISGLPDYDKLNKDKNLQDLLERTKE